MNMKTTNKLIVDSVKQLSYAIQARKVYEKQEKELKTLIKEFMNGENILDVGEFSVFMQTRTRQGLDTAKLKASLDKDFLKEFEVVTSYEVMDVIEKSNNVAKEQAIEFVMQKVTK